MSHERLAELCPIYAAGALDGEELRELESHLESGCSICEQQIQDYSDLVSMLPRSLPDRPLSPQVKDQVLNAIDSATPEAGPSGVPGPVHKKTPVGSGNWLPWACAIAAGVALLFSLWNLQRLNQELSMNQSELGELKGQVRELQTQLDQEAKEVAFLKDPRVLALLLSGTSQSPDAKGKVFWSPQDGKARFYASQLPLLPTGKTYQLWLIADKPVGAGTFRVNSAGQGSLEVVDLTSSAQGVKFAVSVEPAGGVPQPTGDIYLLGSF